MRCSRPVTMVADKWWGLVTTLAIISVATGYGTDGSKTPTIVAERGPPKLSSRTVFPMTLGSECSDPLQNRYVSTIAPAALGPSSEGVSRRPSTGRRPITSK
jgi:hypothetical protein